ncbi:hypothetical protein KKE45_00905 [Patescibacteria group bacterium]|nr:hypothetical protein [Patescibacteria group bacterium]
MKRVKKKILFLSLAILLLQFHLVRDMLQAFGVKMWLTELWHETWIRASNVLLSLINLNYGKWTEWLMVGIEIAVIWILSRRKKTLRYIYDRLVE